MRVDTIVRARSLLLELHTTCLFHTQPFLKRVYFPGVRTMAKRTGPKEKIQFRAPLGAPKIQIEEL